VYEIKSGSTSPYQLGSNTIYRENTEWTPMTNISGADFDYTTNPFSGLKSAYFPGFTNGQYFKFTDGVLHDLDNYSYVKFYIRLGASFSGKYISVKFNESGTKRTNYLAISNGSYGFNANLLNAWQLVAIPMNEFIYDDVNFNELYFVTSGSGSAFQVDNVQLQSGGITISSGVTSFNGMTGNVIGAFADSAKINSDTSLYEFYNKYTGARVFTLPTLMVNLTPRDTCIVIDSIGPRQYTIGLNPYCVGSGSGYTDTSLIREIVSDSIVGKLNISDTASMLSGYQSGINAKQPLLVSGTNIKTVNGNSLLGSGDLSISGSTGTSVSNKVQPLLNIPMGSFFRNFGDSYTASGTYLLTVDSALGLVSQNKGVAGTGFNSSVSQSFLYDSSITTPVAMSIMSGLNDLRNLGSSPAVIEKIKGGIRAIISNHFLSVAIPANSVLVSTTGTWGTVTPSTIVNKSELSLGGLARVSTVAGSSLSVNISGTGIIVGCFGSDSTQSNDGGFSVTIDGVLKNTFWSNGKNIYRLSYDNNVKEIPNAVVVSGLKDTVHNVVIATLDNRRTVIDYIGGIDGKFKPPLIVSSITKLPDSGYRTITPVTNLINNSSIDSVNLEIVNTINEFKDLNLYLSYADIGKYINYNTQWSADSVHPNATGYYQIGLNILDNFTSTSQFNSLFTSGFPVTSKFIWGSSFANGNLRLNGTSNGTRGTSAVGIQTAGGYTTIGSTNVINGAALSLTGGIAATAGLQVQGASPSTTGIGLEIEYLGGSGYVTAYNRTGGAWLPLNIRSSVTTFTAGGTGLGVLNSTGWRLGDATAATTDKLEVNGSIKLATAGNKLKIATGTNASVGTATLVGGTVTVSTTAALTASLIYVTVKTPGGTQGFLSVPTITNATSFVINSTSALETSTVNWWIIN